MTLKKYKRIFIFDTETSSLSPEKFGEILELGGILLTRDGDTGEYNRKDISTLVKNEFPILNSDIHHITTNMCQKEGITKEELFDILKDIFGDYKDTLIVAYNLPFDLKFVDVFMNKMSKNYKITNPTLDILDIVKDRTGLTRGNKLKDMIVKYKVEEVQNSHRALDDCEALLGVMKAMELENDNFIDYVKE